MGHHVIHAEFKAVVLSTEINLNAIARHFGINRKLNWEESLLLTENALQGIIPHPEGKQVYVFHFGSTVFVNCQHHEIMDVIQYLNRIEKSLSTATFFEYTDDYTLEIDDSQQPAINNDFMVAVEHHAYQREIIATVLAKSVALEKIEKDIELLLDDIEYIINFLHQGKLKISDEKLAKLSARILRYKFNSISYIMLLDKPDITWINEDAALLFTELSALFELADRYEKIRVKSEILMDITEVFSGLAHSKRGHRLEWGVIILICIEIVLSLITMFWSK